MTTTAPTPAGPPVVHSDAGIRIGTVDADGEVQDFAGIHIGHRDPDGTVYDFRGVRLGAVDPTR